MIMMTSFITISLRMLKNSIMSLAFSPILPMQMPNAMKKPIRPVTENHKCLKLKAPVWSGVTTMAWCNFNSEMRSFTFTVNNIRFALMFAFVEFCKCNTENTAFTSAATTTLAMAMLVGLSTSLVQTEISVNCWMNSHDIWYRYSWIESLTCISFRINRLTFSSG